MPLFPYEWLYDTLLNRSGCALQHEHYLRRSQVVRAAALDNETACFQFFDGWWYTSLNVSIEVLIRLQARVISTTKTYESDELDDALILRFQDPNFFG